jgi:uncharacterized protein (TIGR02147 family)
VHLGISSGTLSRILNGTRHLGPRLLPKLVAFAGLKKREAEYFRLLVSFESVNETGKKQEYYQRICRMRSRNNTVVTEENHRFFEQWYNVVLFELLRIAGDPTDYTALSALFIPPLSESKIRKALTMLEKLGYVKFDKNHNAHTEPFLTTGDTWESVAIHSFQKAMAAMAAQALDAVPKEERDFSTLTMALSEEAFNKIRTVVKEAREEIAQIERSVKNPQRVYQINLQCFPLTSSPDTEEKQK